MPVAGCVAWCFPTFNFSLKKTTNKKTPNKYKQTKQTKPQQITDLGTVSNEVGLLTKPERL